MSSYTDDDILALVKSLAEVAAFTTADMQAFHKHVEELTDNDVVMLATFDYTAYTLLGWSFIDCTTMRRSVEETDKWPAFVASLKSALLQQHLENLCQQTRRSIHKLHNQHWLRAASVEHNFAKVCAVHGATDVAILAVDAMTVDNILSA